MIRVGGAVALLATAALLAASVSRPARADDDAVAYLSLKYEGECDKDNHRLWLTNAHTSRTIIATIRWNLARSKRVVTDQFEMTPAQTREIGCAAQSEISSAQFSP